jgi:hypothetical protein
MALVSSLAWDPEDESYKSDVFGFTKPFAGDLDRLREHAEAKTGLELDARTVDEAIRTLADCGLLKVTDDAYAGRYVKVFSDRLATFVDSAREELTKFEKNDKLYVHPNREDYPSAHALLAHEVVDDYHEFGDDWLARALHGIREIQHNNSRLPEAGEALPLTILASDRIVTIDHNQREELESSTTALIDELEKENAVDGDPNARTWMLGQLRAARELFRAQVLNAWIAQALLMDILRTLKQKYEGHVIGATAATLMELMIKHGLGSN